jgi:transglutaminase-like putative cysteine protease
MTSPARYYVVHETRYGYGQPVALSRQLVRLEPRELPWQECEQFALSITPEPDVLSRSEDAFGNPVTAMCIEKSHAELCVRASYWAVVSDRALPDEGASLPWEAVRDRLAYRAGRPPAPEDLLAARFLFESPRVRNKREIAAWAADCFPAGTPVLAGARALTERIHQDFVFDPGATTVSTPVTEVFARRRGVCQDFAHFMLSCLRSLGLAARYVSGYLLTHPPPGRPRLVGADASHAWVSVYSPDTGWTDLDPTNGAPAGKDHVTVGWGRDYEDVAPLRGVLLGGGSHSIDIAVTVAPASEYDALFGKNAAAPSASGRNAPVEQMPVGDRPTGDQPVGDRPTGDAPVRP